MDFCYARDAENLSRLAQALRPYNPRRRGAPEGLPLRFDEDTLRSGPNFTLTTDLEDIDLMGEVSGLGDYLAALAASTSVELYGGAVTLRLDGAQRRIYIRRFEYVSFASDEEARYRFLALWREEKSLDSAAEIERMAEE